MMAIDFSAFPSVERLGDATSYRHAKAGRAINIH